MEKIFGENNNVYDIMEDESLKKKLGIQFY